ncbi:MAG TPA: hypothetical protein VFX59_23580 [Polyangiales bacterium]|nr:hypothetical protein [Polyangiales bacterium]
MKRALLITLVLAGCSKESVREAPTEARSALQEACPGAVAPIEHGKVCTELGCESGFSVVFQPKAPWPEGSYRFQFDVDGRMVTCTGKLPLRSCSHRNAMCDGDVVLAESGCDLPAASHSFWSVSFSGFPREIKAAAFLEGKPIGDATLKPKYARSQPNGPGCGPVCCAASDELQLRL